MPQLDRFLSVMVRSRADALVLAEGDVAKLEVAGAAKPITKQPLTGPQIVMLLREIASPEAIELLDGGLAPEFRYESADGAFTARASNEAGRWSVAIALEDSMALAGASESHGAGALGGMSSGFGAGESNGAMKAEPRAAARTGAQP